MTTTKNMNYLLVRNDAKQSIVLPHDLKMAVIKAANKQNMNASQYFKLAAIEKLERESDSKE